MGSFEQNLRKQIVQSLLPRQSQNPLRTIGLSPLILELGMSDDELYRYCRDMARDLLVHFHPDRHGTNPIAVTFQRRFSEAFDLLKSRDVFNAALSQFKEQKGELQSENTELREVAAAVRELADENREKLAAAEAELKNKSCQLEQQIDKYFNLLHLSGAKIASGKEKDQMVAGIRQPERLILLEFDFTPAILPDPGIVVSLQERYERNTQHRLWDSEERESFSSSLNRHEVGAVPPAQLFEKALRSRELFPAIDWDINDRYQELGFTRFVYPGTKEAAQTPQPDGSCSKEELSRRYREALNQVKQLICERAPGVTSLSVRLACHTVENGYLVYSRYNHPILGSIQAQNLNPRQLKMGEKASTKRRLRVHLGHDLPDPIVLAHLHPLLVRGSVLALQAIHQLRISAGSGPEEVYERVKRTRSVSVNHVILEIV